MDRDTSRSGVFVNQIIVIALARVTIVLGKLEKGNLSQVKSVGGGVMGYRFDFGPGYRLYFGWDCEVLVIMLIGGDLIGGDKRRQQRDIDAAIALWDDYRRDRRRSRLCAGSGNNRLS